MLEIIDNDRCQAFVHHFISFSFQIHSEIPRIGEARDKQRVEQIKKKEKKETFNSSEIEKFLQNSSKRHTHPPFEFRIKNHQDR